MNAIQKRLIAAGIVCLILGVTSSDATVVEPAGTFTTGGKEVAYYRQGGSLSNTCDYDWWYGCSATSAGMLIGYYDRNGFGNLVPGGVADPNTFGNPGALVNQSIASTGHQYDFYNASTYGYNNGGGPGFGYGESGDDIGPTRPFDCLADFMGTNQDIAGNSNGMTSFYYWLNGDPFTPTDVVNYGVTTFSGMYGIGEYLDYRGYSAATLYNQLLPNVADIIWPGEPTNPLGFTYEQYKSEIDAGRPVLIQVETHTMLGYGYVDGTSDIYVYDTWSLGGGLMTWGGTYSGLLHYGVTPLMVVPEPATVALLGLGALSLLRKRRV